MTCFGRSLTVYRRFAERGWLFSSEELLNIRCSDGRISVYVFISLSKMLLSRNFCEKTRNRVKIFKRNPKMCETNRGILFVCTLRNSHLIFLTSFRESGPLFMSLRKKFLNEEFAWNLSFSFACLYWSSAFVCYCTVIFNPLQKKMKLFYLKTQIVPRSKNFSSQL